MNGTIRDQYDVFLSHSSRDKPWVGEFAGQLREKGLKVFYDAVEIPAGGDFRRHIARALSGTKTRLVLLLTQHAIKSDWVYWEFTLVANPDPGNRQERVIFVYLEDVRHLLPTEMSYPSSPVLLFDENTRKQNWERLLGALGLGPDALPTPSLDKLARSVEPQVLPPAPRPKQFHALHPPAPPAHFFGRDVELSQLDEALITARQTPVVAIVSIGGQGKSTLVWRWLTMRQGELPHEVVFYSTAYRGGFSFLRFLEAALLELGRGRVDLREIVRTDDRIACLSRLLAERPILLVIDGIERWLRGWEKSDDPMAAVRRDDLRSSEASAGLDLFLQDAAALTNGSQLLLTTQALPLALDGRRVTRISTEAAGARDRKLEGLDDEAAIALLRSLNVTGSDDVLRAAANEYGNHPLAVRALGSLLAEEYGGDIARRPDVRHLVEIEDKIAVLLRDLEERRPQDVPLLQIASLCFDEAPLPAIAAGLGKEQMPRDTEIRARLAALDRWGIVDFDGAGEGCVRLHPLIQRHFEATVANPTPIHRRLSDYFEAIPIAKEASRLDEVRPRILAIEHAFAAGDVGKCRHLLFGRMNERFTLETWFWAWGQFEFAVALERRLAERARPETRAAFLISIGVNEWFLGNLAAALRDYDAAITIRRELVEQEGRRDLRNELAGSLQNRALVHRRRDELDAALRDYNAAITIRRELVEREGRRDLRNDLARSLLHHATAKAKRGAKSALPDANEGLQLWRDLLAEGQRQHRALYVHFLAVAARDFDVPAAQADVGVGRVHEGLSVLEAALSEPDGWNEVLGKRAENFFNWTGAVLDELRAAGLDLDRYNRVREAATEASSRFK
jgi:tetratricopeptide (TPR) repeat protein